MGLFGNSQTKEFKNKMADVFNLIANFSYGEIPMSMLSTIERTIEDNYNQLKRLYNGFSDPFEASFNSFTNFTSVLGYKTSIAEGMYIVYLAKELAFRGQRISKETHQQIMIETQTLCNSSSGRIEIINTISKS